VWYLFHVSVIGYDNVEEAFILNMPFQEGLWGDILDAYKPNHTVTLLKARTFLKSL